MGKSRFFIVLLFLLFLHAKTFSQTDTSLNPGYIPLKKLFSPDYTTAWKTTILPSSPSSIPFFCKWEKVIEKHSKVPFRFRIGNLDYVNTLENKK
jgi:hypothetical protein